MVARGREQIMSGGRGVAAMRWHADAGERCEVCLSCNVPIMFRWTKRDAARSGCDAVCAANGAELASRRAVRMDYRYDFCRKRYTQKTRHPSCSASREIAILAAHTIRRQRQPHTYRARGTAPVSSRSSPHLSLLRVEPEQDRRRGASVTLSLYRAHSWPYHTARMAVSHNAPLHTGWTPQLSGSLPRAH